MLFRDKAAVPVLGETSWRETWLEEYYWQRARHQTLITLLLMLVALDAEYLPVSPRISPCLPVSPRIAPYRPVSPRISPPQKRKTYSCLSNQRSRGHAVRCIDRAQLYSLFSQPLVLTR